MEKMLQYLYGMDYDNELESDENCDQESKTIIPTLSSGVLSHDAPNGETLKAELVADDSKLAGRKSPAHFHAQMYTIGDKYDIPGLRSLARQKFESDIVVDWQQATFIPIIDLVYGPDGPGDGGLRRTVCEVALQNLRSLSTLPAFDLILQKTPDFAYEFAQVMIAKLTLAGESDPLFLKYVT